MIGKKKIDLETLCKIFEYSAHRNTYKVRLFLELRSTNFSFHPCTQCLRNSNMKKKISTSQIVQRSKSQSDDFAKEFEG